MLPKSIRMGKNDFKVISLKKSDTKYFLPSFIVNVYDNPRNVIKISVIVSKKNVAKASHRNLIKRRLKHVIGLNKTKLVSGYYVFVLKNNLKIDTLSYEKISSEFNLFLSKISKF